MKILIYNNQLELDINFLPLLRMNVHIHDQDLRSIFLKTYLIPLI